MNENTTQQKVVTLEALQAVRPTLVTKAEVEAEVKKQVEATSATGVTYATTEEVLAIFEDAPEEA